MRHPCLQPAGVGEPEPAINTTPLIDLMLVLLVMFILSIPIATHKVPLDLPGGPGEPAPFHRLGLDAAGRFSWDGRPMPDAQLTPRLRALARDPAAPALHIEVDAETRYARVDETLAAIRRAGIARMGFVGNERFARMLDASPRTPAPGPAGAAER